MECIYNSRESISLQDINFLSKIENYFNIENLLKYKIPI